MRRFESRRLDTARTTFIPSAAKRSARKAHHPRILPRPLAWAIDHLPAPPYSEFATLRRDDAHADWGSMKCLQCNAENPAGSNFCLRCGARLGGTCGACAAELAPGSRFCNLCGAPTGGETPEERAAAPSSYTPRHLADKILKSKSALQGERKQVTVLFCDIVESSKLAERLDAERMHEVMDRALRLMAEAVHRFEGTVNQFLGDGIMALFGAPIALEDHALRAVRAALAIQETIGGYSSQLSDTHGTQLRLRIGINTGPVVVGKIGDDLRMDYTAIGDTTHVAARLEGLAQPGTILVSDATHRLVHGYIRSESKGTVQVKGREAPISVRKVTGRRRTRSRLELSAERGLTEFIGRRRELGILHDCLARAKAGKGQVVTISGEAGAGKSRLLHEFRKSLEGDAVTWLEGPCEPYAQSMPYSSVLQILRADFHIEEGDNSLQIQQKLRHGMALLDPSLESGLPYLCELFNIPSEDASLKHLDPQIRRRRTFDALNALTIAGSQRRPFIAVIEDMHWIDSVSEDYYAHLADSIAGIPLLLVTAHRPGYSVRWGDKTYYTHIPLDLLSEREAEAMTATLLGSRCLPSALFRIIWDKAEGNPLFVEEITLSLLERGILRRGPDVQWPEDTSVDVPPTVQDIVRARIDRLEATVKRTLQNAAVIGREFALRLLSSICEAPIDVDASLDTLKRLELIHESRVVPEREFMFKHAIIQDVAYEGMLVQQRKLIHGEIGRVIEELHADSLEEHAPLLAHHYSRSEHLDRAFEYAVKAGDRAVRLHANVQARAFYEQALMIARRLPPSSATAVQSEMQAILRLAAVSATRQDIDRDLSNLAQAQAKAQESGDERMQARLLYWFGRHHYVLGNPETALSRATQSLQIADRIGEDAIAALPVNLMGRIHAFRAEFRTAGELLERSVRQMRLLDNKREESTAAGLAGWVLGEQGEFDRARTYADDGIRLAQEIHDPFAESAAFLYRGLIGIASGNLPQAEADFATARRVAERVEDRLRVYLAVWLQGQAYSMAGNHRLGRVLLEESLARAGQIGTKFFLAGPKAALANCLVAAGEIRAARALCQEALEIARETGDRFFGALANRALGLALAEPSPADCEGAERAIQEAIRVQKEIRAAPELARSYVSYSRLLHRLGRPDDAAPYAGEAFRIFRQLGMTWDLAAVERPD